MSDARFLSDGPVSVGSAQDYSTDDIQQILTIAMGRETSSAEQLEEMATELSIDKETLNYAVDVWRSRKAELQQKQQRRQRFYRYELLPYVAVNGFLLILNISIAGTVTWAIYPLLGWGLGLLLSGGVCSHKPRRQVALSPSGRSVVNKQREMA